MVMMQTKFEMQRMRDGSVVYLCFFCRHPVEGHSVWEHPVAESGCTEEGCRCSETAVSLAPQQGEMARILPDGRYAVLYKLIFGYRILIGPLMDWAIGGSDVYDYDRTVTAQEFLLWDGYGAPEDPVRYQIGNSPVDDEDDRWVRPRNV